MVDEMGGGVAVYSMAGQHDVLAGVEQLNLTAVAARLAPLAPGLYPGPQVVKATATDQRESPHRANHFAVADSELETIRASYAALNKGDMQEALEALHRDAVWRESAELPGGDEFDGRAAIEEFLAGFLDQWDVFHQRVESTLRRGDRVLVNINLTAVGRESGAEVNARYAHIWTLRDGLGAEVDAYYDPERALRELEA